uniref:Alcohol dehydrogenase transcription factor myb/sant-like protein n=1 Tax=Culex tarsalis TaxID=7177 RepID=A0A1Q3F3M9_CULTA
MEAPPTRCRLCLATPGRTKLQDIFHQEDHFVCKLRECTGVYVSRQDALTTICANCVETVRFIDEFRSVCRQADRNLGGSAAAGFDSARCESYAYCVGELRKLLVPQEAAGGSGYLPETVFVQQQAAGGGEVGFEWEDCEGVVDIKQEVVGSEDEEDDYEEQEEEVEEDDEEDGGAPKRKKNRINWEIDPLTLAKAIHKYPVLWNAKQDGHRMAYQRDLAWNKLAKEIGLDKAQLKKMWCRMNDMLHRKRWSTEQSDVELYQLLETMFSSNFRRRRKFGLTKETRAAMDKMTTEDSEDERMKLAQIIYKHEDIWNRTHPDFDKPAKWTNLATQLNTSVELLKNHWKRFKDIYYARRRRLLVGEIKPNHPCLQDPFFLLLEKMWVGSARSNSRNPAAAPTPASTPKSYEEIEPLSPVNRMQLTQLIYAREVIWNRAHPDYPVLAKRDEAFDEVGRLLGMTMLQLKHHWRTLRSFYRNRYIRLKRGQLAPDHPLLHEPVYLLLQKIFGDDSGVEEGA